MPVKIPNSIMVQASIFIHNSEKLRKIRSKYEVSKDLDPETVIKELKPKIEKIEGVLEVDIKVLETTFTTYILGIDTIAKSIFEEPIRDQVLRITMKTIKELQIGNGQKQLAKS